MKKDSDKTSHLLEINRKQNPQVTTKELKDNLTEGVKALENLTCGLSESTSEERKQHLENPETIQKLHEMSEIEVEFLLTQVSVNKRQTVLDVAITVCRLNFIHEIKLAFPLTYIYVYCIYLYILNICLV